MTSENNTKAPNLTVGRANFSNILTSHENQNQKIWTYFSLFLYPEVSGDHKNAEGMVGHPRQFFANLGCSYAPWKLLLFLSSISLDTHVNKYGRQFQNEAGNQSSKGSIFSQNSYNYWIILKYNIDSYKEPQQYLPFQNLFLWQKKIHARKWPHAENCCVLP